MMSRHDNYDCPTSYGVFDIWIYLFVNMWMLAIVLVSCCRRKSEKESDKTSLPQPQVYSVQYGGGLQPMDDDMMHVADSRSGKSSNDANIEIHPRTAKAADALESSAYSEGALMNNLKGIADERKKQLEKKKAAKDRTKKERKGHSRPSAIVMEPSQVTKMTLGVKKDDKNATVHEKVAHAKRTTEQTVDGGGETREGSPAHPNVTKVATAGTAAGAKAPKKDRDGTSEDERTSGGGQRRRNGKTNGGGKMTKNSTRTSTKTRNNGRRTRPTNSTKTRDKLKDAATNIENAV